MQPDVRGDAAGMSDQVLEDLEADGTTRRSQHVHETVLLCSGDFQRTTGLRGLV
jgi:hypothetical protein